jgi:hypothetical protein
VIHDPAVSVPWRDCDEVQRVFAAWAEPGYADRTARLLA